MEEACSNLGEELGIFFESADASEFDRLSQPDVFITHVEVSVR